MPDNVLFVDDVELFPSDENPERDCYIAELIRIYGEAVRRLSPEEQVAHHYVVIEGFDAWAVAEVMGISTKAASNHVSHAKRKILRYVRWKKDGKSLGNRPFHGGDRVGPVSGRAVREVGGDRMLGVQCDGGPGNDADRETSGDRPAGGRGHELSQEPYSHEKHQHVCGDGKDRRRDEVA